METNRSNEEFLYGLEDYLQYIGDDFQAKLIHSLAKSFNSDDVFTDALKMYLKYITTIVSDTDKNLADLCHSASTAGINDLEQTIIRHSANVITSDTDNELLAEFLFKYGKLEYRDKVIEKVLLHYVARTLETGQDYSSLPELLFKVNKRLDHNLKSDEIVLHYTANTVSDSIPELADFLYGINKSIDRKDYAKSLLIYVSTRLEKLGIPDYSDLTARLSKAFADDNLEDAITECFLLSLDTQYPKDKLFRGIVNYKKTGKDLTVINDAFSRSQIQSKIWLVEELQKIIGKGYYNNVAILAGWMGQLTQIFTKKMLFEKCRIVEVDKECCIESDYNFNLDRFENYKVKSVHSDINELELTTKGYEWEVENFKTGQKYTEQFLPDLVINTSAEHMDTSWFHQLRFKDWSKKPIVAIQSNNFFSIDEHINCVHSIDHMKKVFPMSEVLYEGELQLKGYKRVMLIGRP